MHRTWASYGIKTSKETKKTYKIHTLKLVNFFVEKNNLIWNKSSLNIYIFFEKVIRQFIYICFQYYIDILNIGVGDVGF